MPSDTLPIIGHAGASEYLRRKYGIERKAATLLATYEAIAAALAREIEKLRSWPHDDPPPVECVPVSLGHVGEAVANRLVQKRLSRVLNTAANELALTFARK